MALQFSIETLIEKARSPCGFYTLTIPEILNWREVSRRHRKCLNNMLTDVQRRIIPPVAGVRVFEEGETTFRPHVHWIMTPRLSHAVVSAYAHQVGLGHVWLDPRPATVHLGMYLSKYLSKSRGIKGVRRWATFGPWSGVKVKDVHMESPEIEAFRQDMQSCIKEGMQPKQAFTESIRRANLRKYGMQFRDPLQGGTCPLPEESTPQGGPPAHIKKDLTTGEASA